VDRFPINPRRVVIFLCILVLVLMVIDFNSRLEELNLLKKQAGIISTQVTQVAQTESALQTQVAYAGSNQAVQDSARSEGHYIQPGDQPVVPVGQANATPLQNPDPTPSPTPLANWQVWWNLFFGGQ
jgi:hypothetical protein